MAVTLDIDGSVEKISAKLRQTKADLEGVAEGYERIDGASKQAVNGSVSGQEKMAGAAKSTGNELNKQAGIITKLENHLKRLEKGQKKTNDPKLVKKYNTEIVKTRGALASLRGAGTGSFTAINGAAKGSQAVFASLKATLSTTFAPLFAAGAAIQGIRAIVGLVSEYEQTAADLSAITGANGDTLEFLKQSAVEVGLETTISAAQTLEAYKLIASAKPELLSNAEGLAQITREAVTLTEAMGGDLPTAATNLTDIMNQFNAPADEAARFVNALAAGSKEGSADVGQLASAFLVSGTEMKSANVQFEEGVGLLETLAEKGRKGAEAGTGLRNILSKLSATDVLPKEATQRLEAAGVDIESLSDKSLTFSDRLRALAPIQNDANALVSVFGLENKATAQILLGNIDRVDELTAAVTDTNIAQEQAATRTATVRGEFAKLTNTLQAVIQDNGDGLGNFLALLIRFVREGVLFLKDRIDDLRPTFSAFSETVGGLFDAIRPLIPAQKQAAEGASTWSKLVKAANVPIKILFNILGAGIKVITSVITAFSELVARNRRLQAFFINVRTAAEGMFNVFLDLPAYVSGGLAAVKTFVAEAAKSIGTLGSNVGSVIKEAFSFGKLIKSGTDDLNAAVSDLLSNPFEGVGSKAAEAFTAEFNASKETLVVPVTTAVVSGDTPVADVPDAPTGGDSAPAFSRGSEDAKKEAEKAAKEAAKIEADKQRTILAAMADGRDKQLALEEARFTDLMAKLEKYGLDSSDAVFQNELNKFNIKQKFLEDAASLEGLSGEERINYLYNQTKAEIDAIESALSQAGGGSLAEEQVKQINLLRKKASEDYLGSLEEFQSKEQQKAQEHEIALLELKRDGFNSQTEFEEFKEKEILDIRLRYAEAQLAVLEKLQGAESTAALNLRKTINEIKGDLAEIDKLGGGAKDFNVYSLFGLDPDDPESQKVIKGIETAAAATIDVLTQVNEMRLASAQAAIDASDEEIEAIQEKIDAKEDELDEQESLAAEGFANNASAVQNEINLLKQQQAAEKVERDKALKEKQKIQKQQAVIDTITQASSLITASAQVFQSVAAIPFVGPVIGAALVAAMIGSFIAAKAKVFQNINKQKAEKGMFGMVKGKRHYQGGEAFGDHIEVEDGEAFGVLSRGATKKYGKAYEAFTNAANKKDKMGMAKVAAMLGAGIKVDKATAEKLDDKEAKIVQLKTEVTAKMQSEELRENNRLLRALVDQGNTTNRDVEYRNGRKIIRTGNSTRIVKQASNG